MTVAEFSPGLVLRGVPEPGDPGQGLVLKPSLFVKDVKPLVLGAPGDTLIVPAQLDARSQLLQSGDQGSSDECVGHAMAGMLEFWNWKYLGRTVHIDPHQIYVRAKEIDGIKQAGTTLAAGFQAAQDLKLMPPLHTSLIREISNWWEIQRALHLYTMVLGAFEITDKWMEATADGWVRPGGKVLGGHACLICGFSNAGPEPFFEWQGSWGPQGWRGFNRMSIDLFKEQFQYGLVAHWPG